MIPHRNRPTRDGERKREMSGKRDLEFRVKKTREIFVVPIKDQKVRGFHLENEINGQFSRTVGFSKHHHPHKLKILDRLTPPGHAKIVWNTS
jgi:hypothetical protein